MREIATVSGTEWWINSTAVHHAERGLPGLCSRGDQRDSSDKDSPSLCISTAASMAPDDEKGSHLSISIIRDCRTLKTMFIF